MSSKKAILPIWFQKYDRLTLFNPSFPSLLPNLLKSIDGLPDIPPFPFVSLEESIFLLSEVEYERILQKVLLKIMEILFNYFRSEYVIIEKEECRTFCAEMLHFLYLEKQYFNSFWNNNPLYDKKFKGNRIWASFIRMFYSIQNWLRFCFEDEHAIFIEMNEKDCFFSYESTYLIIDCLALLIKEALRKVSHLSTILENEINLLLRMFNLIINFKTMSYRSNFEEGEAIISYKQLNILANSVIDLIKMSNRTQKSEIIEIEFEEEDNTSSHIENPNERKIFDKVTSVKSEIEYPQINENPIISVEIPDVLPQLKNINNSNAYSNSNLNIGKPRYYKNSSVFFEEITKEEEKETPPHDKHNIRKSLLGETRKSLLYENLSMNNLLLHDEGNKNNSNYKSSKFKDYKDFERESPRETISTNITSTIRKAPDLTTIYLSSKESIRTFGESAIRYTPIKKISSSNSIEESVLKSVMFSRSVNLPKNSSLIQSIHPSVISRREGGAEEGREGNRDEGHKLLWKNRNDTFENDDIYNLQAKEDNPLFRAINEKLNDNLVRMLTEIHNEHDQIKKDIIEKKGEKKNETIKIGKKENKKKKELLMYAMDLDASENLSPPTKINDGDFTPTKNNKVLKELKKHSTIDHDDEIKLKRKSNRMGTEKLGITEKDLIKIDKTTEIKEKLQYVNFLEKEEEGVALDEQIIITTMTDENNLTEMEKEKLVVKNEFIDSTLISFGKNKTSKPLNKLYDVKKENSDFYSLENHIPYEQIHVINKILSDQESVKEVKNGFYVAAGNRKRLK